jgi:hypothetical protein
MFDILVWLYLINASLLIAHEIDSAYWKEWELFKLPGGAGFFVLLHVILVFIFLLGLVWLVQENSGGLVLSLILGVAGIGAFSIHTWFIRKGHQQFKTTVSQLVLIATLIASLIQVVLTLIRIFRGQG